MDSIAKIMNAAAMMHKQTITPSSTLITANSGDKFDLTLTYSSNSDMLAGIGVKLFFDSRKLTFNGLQSVFSQGKLAVDLQPKRAADFADQLEDDDSNTDQFIHLAWMSVDGKWPGEGKLPVDLLTASFSLAEDFSGTSKINFIGEPVNNAVFESQSVVVQLEQTILEETAPQVDVSVGIIQTIISFILKLFGVKR